MPNRVLIAGHSQVKYFDQYLNDLMLMLYPSKWTPGPVFIKLLNLSVP